MKFWTAAAARPLWVVPVLAALLTSPLLAGTPSGTRLMPEDTVLLVHNCAILDREVPVPDGMLATGNGRSLIEGDGMQIAVDAKTVFAFRDEIDRSRLTVEQGVIEFALRPGAKPTEFKLPFDTVQASPAAGSDGVVGGTLDVTADKAVLTMTWGALEISKEDRRKIVPPGCSIDLGRFTFDEGSVGAPSEPAGIGPGLAAGLAAASGLTAGALALSAGSDGSGGDDSGKAVSPY